jgi:hypothetical protein
MSFVLLGEKLCRRISMWARFILSEVHVGLVEGVLHIPVGEGVAQVFILTVWIVVVGHGVVADLLVHQVAQIDLVGGRVDV